MNFENQVNRSETTPSPTKRFRTNDTTDSPKSVSSAALESVSKTFANIKLSPRKDADRERTTRASPSLPSNASSAKRLAVDRSPTRQGQSGLPVRRLGTSTPDEGGGGSGSGSGDDARSAQKKHEMEVLRELTPEEMAIIRSRESRRLATMSQMYFLDHYFDLLKYLNNRKVRTQTWKETHRDLDDASFQREWRRNCGRERAYLRKRRTKVKHGDFQILAQVGQGGYGSVHLAQKRDTKEVVALKVMSKALLHKMDEIRHILTERDILTNAKSEWLVNLLYSFQDSKNVYLAMEYVAGGDFRTLLTNSGVLHDQHARFYIAEMFLSVDELHKLGYIHRDLKPENFLISNEGHIKLTDFGLASGMINTQKIESMRVKLESASSDVSRINHYSTLDRQKMYRSLRAMEPALAYSVVGSPDYMAPEVLKGAEYNHTVDYWSLGCMLFECLSGYPPFSGESVAQTWSNLKNWRTVLKRPHYEAPEHAEFNLTDEAWDFITAVICSDRRRLLSLAQVKSHAYFLRPAAASAAEGRRDFDFDRVREQKVPFKPKLSSPTDHGYFDNFESEEDMSKYREVHEKQAQLEKLAERSGGMKREAWVGFTFKHEGDAGDAFSTLF